jgi:flavin reductase (DIM6/NTAB) family NADH-FMN oxidoreductase RutF
LTTPNQQQTCQGQWTNIQLPRWASDYCYVHFRLHQSYHQWHRRSSPWPHQTTAHFRNLGKCKHDTTRGLELTMWKPTLCIRSLARPKSTIRIWPTRVHRPVNAVQSLCMARGWRYSSSSGAQQTMTTSGGGSQQPTRQLFPSQRPYFRGESAHPDNQEAAVDNRGQSGRRFLAGEGVAQPTIASSDALNEIVDAADDATTVTLPQTGPRARWDTFPHTENSGEHDRDGESLRIRKHGSLTFADTKIIKQNGAGKSTTVEKAINEIRTRMVPIMRRVVHPIAIVTSTDTSISPRGEPFSWRGITVSSMNTVTMDPPVVSFNIKMPSSTWDAIKASSKFNVHLLANDPEAAKIATRFASGSNTLFYDQRGELEAWASRANANVTGPNLQMDSDAPVIWPKTLPPRAIFRCRHLRDKSVTIGDHCVVFGEVFYVTMVSGNDKTTPFLSYVDGRYSCDQGSWSRDNPAAGKAGSTGGGRHKRMDLTSHSKLEGEG